MESLKRFGPELRRRRLDAGLTLERLAALVHYSKGQLSKVETGRQRPTSELARLCDTVLKADGALSALARTEADPREGKVRPSRRAVMAVGAASALGLGVPTARATKPWEVGSSSLALTTAETLGDSLVQSAQTMFGEYRRLGQVAPPEAVLPALSAQTRSLQSLAGLSDPRTGRALLVLSARYAEFAGWMAQESGDDAAALRWTAHAGDLAEAGGDRDLASYALVRRALITFYGEDAQATIELAQGAQGGRLPSRIRGLAAQREAQGHALAGNRTLCLRALDRGRDLLVRSAVDDVPGPVIGTTHLSDPVSMATGWCLLDLGLPARAAEALDREVARIPAQALRTQVRYGVRRALSHAVAGEIDHACAIVSPLLAGVDVLASATVRIDLRRLSRTLSRHRTHAAVRELSPRLTAALYDPPRTAPVREEPTRA